MTKPARKKNTSNSKKKRHIKPKGVSSCKCAEAGGVNQSCHGFTGGVKKHGGDVLKNPKVAAIYWGSFFFANPDVTTTFDQFFAQLFASSYFGSMSKDYGVSGPTFMGGTALVGGLHPNQGGVESQIQSWLTKGQLPIPVSSADAKDWVYVLVPPPGEVVFDNGDESDVSICGYHGHHSFQFRFERVWI